MTPTRLILSIVIATAWSSASAETTRFEEAAAMLAASCAKDIVSNCRGVNPDPTRLKDCLTRNQDVLSPQGKNDYGPAFDAIQKRVASRSAVSKLCARDVAKFCAGVHKGDSSKALECLLAGPRGMTINCSKAIAEA